MTTILNLTQHEASETQHQAGVRDTLYTDILKDLLTFVGCPTKEEVLERAEALADFAAESTAPAVMIGGAPFFMGALETALKARGIRVLYAFSERVSEDDPETGKKVSVFKHLGFYEA